MTFPTQKLAARKIPAFFLWWSVLFGLLTMYWPAYYNLAAVLWKIKVQKHGVMAIKVILCSRYEPERNLDLCAARFAQAYLHERFINGRERFRHGTTNLPEGGLP